MKILLAPNALKGSCSASLAAEAMALGLSRVVPDADLARVPVADGGDGLVEVAFEALGAERVDVSVAGPRFEPVQAAFA